MSTHDELESKAQAYCINNPIGRIIKPNENKTEKIRSNKNEALNNKPRFKYGRYKNKRIDKCLDLNYLIWAYKNIDLDDFSCEAIEDRIEELKSNK